MSARCLVLLRIFTVDKYIYVSIFERHGFGSKTVKKVIRILFVCLGNICRSPMAEFLCKDMAEKSGISDRLVIASAGTSAEEEGNSVYPPARRELSKHGIDCAGKRAVQMRADDYLKYDYILAMEARNKDRILRICGGDPQKKVFRLLDFSQNPRDIADPWYTGDFSKTYSDIVEGLKGFFAFLRQKRSL